MELVIASFNSHKVQELREALKVLAPHVQVMSLFDFPQYRRPDDAAFDSFEEQAKAKALHASSALKKVCLADDSGIIVPALQKVGAKLLRRYQHDTNSHIEQTKKLLDEIKSFKDLERQAYLECSLAIAAPSGKIKCVTQRSEGYLADEERGKINFEFDSIFIKHDYRKTLGELTSSVKNRISHRRKALEKLIAAIEQFVRA